MQTKRDETKKRIFKLNNFLLTTAVKKKGNKSKAAQFCLYLYDIWIQVLKHQLMNTIKYSIWFGSSLIEHMSYDFNIVSMII